MNPFCYVMLSLIILVGGFAATLVVASIPDTFGWAVTTFRTFLCYLMAFMLFAGTISSIVAIMYKVFITEGSK